MNLLEHYKAWASDSTMTLYEYRKEVDYLRKLLDIEIDLIDRRLDDFYQGADYEEEE